MVSKVISILEALCSSFGDCNGKVDVLIFWWVLNFDLILCNERKIGDRYAAPTMYPELWVQGFLPGRQDPKVVECDVIPLRPRHAERRHDGEKQAGACAISYL